MRKVVYYLIAISLFVLNLGIHAEAYYYVPETTEITKQQKDKLSLYTIFDYEDFDDLLSYATELDSSSLSVIDRYTRDMIIGISQKKTAPLYHRIHFVSAKVSVNHKLIDSLDWDYRFRAIIQLYNRSKNEDLRWRGKQLEDGTFQYCFDSVEYCQLQSQASEIGQTVRIIPGTKYFESAWFDGSGKTGIVTESNPYIPEDFSVIVNGVAYLDTNRNYVTEVIYDVSGNLSGTPIKIGLPRLVHVCTKDGTNLGWVYPEYITLFPK